MPRVKPLGTQPDQRDLEARAAIRGGMERKGYSRTGDFARLMRISDKTAKQRLGHPADLKIGDLRYLVDTLDIPEDDLLRIFYKEGGKKR